MDAYFFFSLGNRQNLPMLLVNCFFSCSCVQESEAVALELEELRREQAGYEQQIQAVDEAMTAIQEQIDSMACTVSQNKVFVSFMCVYI